MSETTKLAIDETTIKDTPYKPPENCEVQI